MDELYSPRSEAELALLKSILGGAGIPYFVRNDTFGSLVAGPHIEMYNRKTIFVARAAQEEARELLAEFLDRTGEAPPPGSPRSFSARDKLRMLLEVVLGGWIMPGRRQRRAHLRLVKGAGTAPPGAPTGRAAAAEAPSRSRRRDER